MSLLLVRIAGLGSRASMATRGEAPPVAGDEGMLGVENFRSKKPGFLPAATLAAFSKN